MEDRRSRVGMFERFKFKVHNFVRLATVDRLYSEPFVLCGYPWRIIVYPFGNEADYMSIYLEALPSPNSNEREIRDVIFKLIVFNHIDINRSITKESNHIFNEMESDWGFATFIPLADLHNPRSGFVVYDTCIIGAEICVNNSSRQANRSGGGRSSRNREMIRRVEVEEEVENVETAVSIEGPNRQMSDVELLLGSISELVEFRGLGKVEKGFVPLLEQVCSRYPSLIECQQTRSRKFIEWAFTALGRVLYFLNTRKVKDMNEKGCKDLQVLWEELQAFRFDLTWLEPHVQYALGIRTYVEKGMEVEKLKQNVATLEMEMERLRLNLVGAEVDLATAIELLNAEGFNENDLNVELGYGIP
ncbi:MATH domain and coiled-coil domain-containing protein At3g58370-like [Cicer arietinum]|uniref:MATH domain and coiled-coil domain-containing protein At3g58360-like n=1 Tax=Cicer arietinum TaxID=3827 RepID=A0A1S2XUY5_CICAR|nr:MATH domain and coiled-coil domain-containing protein At3g58360-like [Cicer arietinum]